VPLKGLRRKIAEHMEHASRTIPHFTFVAECDMSAVVEARRADAPAAQASGVKLTYLAYVIRAVVEALARFPYLNARFDEGAQEIVLSEAVHLGIATATEEGLVVPVLRDAGKLGLLETAREVERLAAGARAKRLALDELSGGTFTITTTGALGGLLATPIIHAPQVAILGVHEVKPKAVVKDGAIVAREMTNLSLSLDHRVVDGQMGAEFLYRVIENLQSPERGAKA
jgi:pyruvate dehydrogenase E2 component (dihydrolipoamide acetyltransferase)